MFRAGEWFNVAGFAREWFSLTSYLVNCHIGCTATGTKCLSLRESVFSNLHNQISDRTTNLSISRLVQGSDQ